MNILAELPAIVTRHLLVEWIGIVEISRLDAAVGGSVRVSPLQSVIWSNRSAYYSQGCICTNKANALIIVRWLLKRKIAVRSLLFKNGCEPPAIKEYLDASGTAVRDISLHSADCKMDILKTIAGMCSHLRELNVATPYDEITMSSVRQAYALPPRPKPRYFDADLSTLAQKCTALVHVSIAEMDISDVAVRALCESCPNMEYLDISGCTAVAGAYARYHLLKQLHYLDLSHTRCTAVVVRSIVLCGNLRSLKLGHALSDEVMQPLVTGCPNLTNFALPKWVGETHRTALSADTLVVLVQNHPLLRSFIFPHQPAVLNVAAKIAAALSSQCCRHLEEVDFTDNRCIRDISVMDLAQGCRQLRRVGLAGTEIGDASLMTLGLHCPALEMVIVRTCRGITDKGVIALVRGCSRLQHFDAEMCLPLTSRCPTALAQFCPDLRVALFNGCNRILLPTVQKIFQRWVCPKLAVEYLKSEKRKVVNDHTIAAAVLNHS